MDDLIPRFELEREIGSGATGHVWRGVLSAPWDDLPTGTEVAVKILRPELRDDPLVRAAFEREGAAGLAARAPGLVRVLGRGEDERGPWIAMAHVAGRTLRAALEESGPLPEPLVRRIAERLAGALAALHAAGFVHGDVKPENVRFDNEGRAVLLDLGFARALGAPAAGGDPDAERRPGSVPYLAPEQARGARGDEKSEVFSLGVLLYEIATGAYPFAPAGAARPEGGDYLGALRSGRFVRPSRRAPTLTPFLDQLLEELLRADPARRPEIGEVRRRFVEQESGQWWRAELDLRPGAQRGGWAGGAQHLTPLVGRERELARLVDMWRGARDGGTGAVAWLSGASGSGKSRLADELAATARRSERPPLFLHARCADSERERPCQPILVLLQLSLRISPETAPGPREFELLDQLVPPLESRALAEALDPHFEGATSAAVPAALATWLVALARSGPLIVFVDDVNLADEGTLDVIRRLAEEVCATSLLLVLGERSDVPWRRPRAGAALRERARAAGRFEQLELEPLDQRAVLAVVGELFHVSAPHLRLAQVLWRRSRGLPGLLVELLRSMIARGDARPHHAGGGLELAVAPDDLPLPRSLAGAIAASYGRLPVADRRWLERLAVAGGRIVPAFLLRAWPGSDAAELDETLARLVAAGWLTPAGDRYRFSRPALREAVYRVPSAQRRRRMHAQVAGALAPGPGEPLSLSDAFQRAWHLRAAGRKAELLRVLRPLLDHLLRRGQPQRVHSLAAWGLEALDALAPSPRLERLSIELLEAAADAADRLGYRADQRQWLDRLSDLDLDPDSDPELAGRVYLLHARLAVSTGRYGMGRSMLRAAVEWFGLSQNAELESDALRRLAAVQAQVGELSEARRLARRALELAPNDLLRAQAELGLGLLDVLDDRIESALRRADRALILLRSVEGQRALGARGLVNLLRARAYRAGGRPLRALGSAQRALRLARRAGEGRLSAEAAARLGGHLLDIGRPQAAERELREALLAAQEIEDRRGEALAARFLGTLLAEDGRPGASELLERALELAREMGFHRLEAVALAIRARVRRQARDLPSALADSERAAGLADRYGAELIDRVVINGTRALILAEAGERERAGELVRALRRRLRRENARVEAPLLKRRMRLSSARLLRAVLSAEGPVYPRVRLG